MLNLGVAGVYAHEKPVKMTFSGTVGAGAINLQPGTANVEESETGNGTFGAFTVRNISAETTAPQSSRTCSGPTHFTHKSGRRGRIALRGWKSIDDDCHGGNRLHRSRCSAGPLYCDFSDQWWNRPFRECIRRPYVDRDGGPGRGRMPLATPFFLPRQANLREQFPEWPESRTTTETSGTSKGHRRVLLLAKNQADS